MEPLKGVRVSSLWIPGKNIQMADIEEAQSKRNAGDWSSPPTANKPDVSNPNQDSIFGRSAKNGICPCVEGLAKVG